MKKFQTLLGIFTLFIICSTQAQIKPKTNAYDPHSPILKFPILYPLDKDLKGANLLKTHKTKPERLNEDIARKEIYKCQSDLGDFYSTNYDGFFCRYPSFNEMENYYKSTLGKININQYYAVRLYCGLNEDNRNYPLELIFKGEVVTTSCPTSSNSLKKCYEVNTSLDYFVIDLFNFQLTRITDKKNKQLYDEYIENFQYVLFRNYENNRIPRQVFFEGESIPFSDFDEIQKYYESTAPSHDSNNLNEYCIHLSPALMNDPKKFHNLYFVIRDGIILPDGRGRIYSAEKFWYNHMDACKNNCPE